MAHRRDCPKRPARPRRGLVSDGTQMVRRRNGLAGRRGGRHQRVRGRTAQLEGPNAAQPAPPPCAGWCGPRRGEHRRDGHRALRVTRFTGHDRAVDGALPSASARGCTSRRSKSSRTAHRYIAGESSAAINRASGGPSKPKFSLQRAAEKGVDDRPTLVQNAETLAHVATIARYGTDWFRKLGTEQSPGSTLLTLCGNVRRPGVYEVDLGARLGSVLAAVGGTATPPAGALVGGYFGTWVAPNALGELPLDAERLRAEHRGSLGCGVVAVLPRGACGIVEVDPDSHLPRGGDIRPVRSLRERAGRADRGDGAHSSLGATVGRYRAGPAMDRNGARPRRVPPPGRSGGPAGKRAERFCGTTSTFICPGVDARASTFPASRPLRPRQTAGGERAGAAQAAGQPDPVRRVRVLRRDSARAHRTGRLGLSDRRRGVDPVTKRCSTTQAGGRHLPAPCPAARGVRTAPWLSRLASRLRY